MQCKHPKLWIILSVYVCVCILVGVLLWHQSKTTPTEPTKVTAPVRPMVKVPGPTNAPPSVPDPYSGSAGKGVSWYFDTHYDRLIFSSEGGQTIEGYEFLEECPWYDFLDQTRYLVVEEGIRNIGANTLSYMPNLMNISLPSTLHWIGGGNFMGCGMESILLPGNSLSLREGFCCDCPNLKTVVFSGQNVSIPTGALENCPKLELIQFGGCSDTWEEYVLLNNDHLRHIPTEFGMENPPLVWNQLEGSGIEWCLDKRNRLLTIRGEGEMPYTRDNPWKSIQRYIHTLVVEEGITKLGASPSFDAYNLLEVSLPQSLETLENMAFRGCKKLQSITLPDLPEYLPSTFFSGSCSLEYIKLPKNLKAIGSRAFVNCTSLKAIDIPPSVTMIETHAFQGCTSLESITLPNGLEGIYHGFFQDCTSLKTVTIPESVTQILDDAFLGCSSLEVIYYGGSREQWENVYISSTSRLPEDIQVVYGK